MHVDCDELFRATCLFLGKLWEGQSVTGEELKLISGETIIINPLCIFSGNSPIIAPLFVGPKPYLTAFQFILNKLEGRPEASYWLDSDKIGVSLDVNGERISSTPTFWNSLKQDVLQHKLGLLKEEFILRIAANLFAELTTLHLNSLIANERKDQLAINEMVSELNVDNAFIVCTLNAFYDAIETHLPLHFSTLVRVLLRRDEQQCPVIEEDLFPPGKWPREMGERASRSVLELEPLEDRPEPLRMRLAQYATRFQVIAEFRAKNFFGGRGGYFAVIIQYKSKYFAVLDSLKKKNGIYVFHIAKEEIQCSVDHASFVVQAKDSKYKVRHSPSGNLLAVKYHGGEWFERVENVFKHV